jgi:hypothetical protein
MEATNGYHSFGYRCIDRENLTIKAGDFLTWRSEHFPSNLGLSDMGDEHVAVGPTWNLGPIFGQSRISYG